MDSKQDSTWSCKTMTSYYDISQGKWIQKQIYCLEKIK